MTNKCQKLSAFLLFGLAIAWGSTGRAATVYMIDFNEAGKTLTEPGWTGLDVGRNDGVGSVMIDGITFSANGASGSRLRLATTGDNALTRDLIFANGTTVSLLIGSAGDLVAGEWNVDVYIFDRDQPTVPTTSDVGYIQNGAETLISSTVVPDVGNAAFSFSFTSDGTSTYEIFARGNDGNTRLNAVRLEFVPPTTIPEPTSLGLTALACMGFGFVTRRTRRRKRN